MSNVNKTKSNEILFINEILLVFLRVVKLTVLLQVEKITSWWTYYYFNTALII